MRTLTSRSLLTFSGLLLLAGCGERPPVDSVQTGFRGIGNVHYSNPRTLEGQVEAAAAAIPQLPGANEFTNAEPAPPGTFQNVQVLGHLSEAEFNRTMLALTSWVAANLPADTPPSGRGCNYCHVVEDGVANFASDAIYTKVVSRRMLQMTQTINSQFANHVNEGGVNCYTCHQGAPLPQNYWFYTDVNQPLRHYLDRDDLRVQSDVALTSDSDVRTSIRQAEYAYALMIDMSQALGVNCTYCHNTGRFADWEASSPQRVKALRGLRMIRHVNMEYLVPLQGVWPENRLGPMGDGPKAECATCHNGAYVPLWNSPAIRATDWPGLYPAPEVAVPVEAQVVEGVELLGGMD